MHVLKRNIVPDPKKIHISKQFHPFLAKSDIRVHQTTFVSLLSDFSPPWIFLFYSLFRWRRWYRDSPSAGEGKQTNIVKRNRHRHHARLQMDDDRQGEEQTFSISRDDHAMADGGRWKSTRSSRFLFFILYRILVLQESGIYGNRWSRLSLSSIVVKSNTGHGLFYYHSSYFPFTLMLIMFF